MKCEELRKHSWHITKYGVCLEEKLLCDCGLGSWADRFFIENRFYLKKCLQTTSHYLENKCSVSGDLCWAFPGVSGHTGQHISPQPQCVFTTVTSPSICSISRNTKIFHGSYKAFSAHSGNLWEWVKSGVISVNTLRNQTIASYLWIYIWNYAINIPSIEKDIHISRWANILRWANSLKTTLKW